MKNAFFLLITFYKTESITAVQRAYRAKFRCKTALSDKVITNIVRTLEKHGSVIGTTKNGAAKSKNEKRSKTMIPEDPSLSTRKAASALQCSQTLIVTVLHDDLHLKPLKFNNWHVIKEHAYAKRLGFAQWFLSLRDSTEFAIHDLFRQSLFLSH